MEENVNVGTAESTTPTTEPAPVQSATFDLDSIINEYLGEEAEASTNHSVNTKEVLESLPPDALKLLQNLRSDYSKKTQALSKQRNELAEREQSWLQRQEEVLRSKMSLPEDFDIYADNGIQSYIQAQVAQALLEAQQPIREAHETAKLREDVAQFKREHPDMENYKEAIVAEMLNDNSIDIKKAYFLVRGREAEKELTNMKAQLEQAKTERFIAAKKVGTGAMAGRPEPQFKNARQAYEHFKTQAARTGQQKP